LFENIERRFIAVKRSVIGLAGLSIALWARALAAQSSLPAQSFSWHAELVALDESAKTATVKTSVVGDAIAEFGNMKPGAQVVVTWSGLDRFADAIRSVRPGDANNSGERFTFPVEFVSFDAERRYVTFKVKVPDSGIPRLKAMKPGEWITATSPHDASSSTQPVAMIRHYNDPVTENSD
jgi:hypothetical protein